MNLEEKELVERLIALSAAVSRYQMALEAATVCDYGPDAKKVIKKALAKL